MWFPRVTPLGFVRDPPRRAGYRVEAASEKGERPWAAEDFLRTVLFFLFHILILYMVVTGFHGF